MAKTNSQRIQEIKAKLQETEVQIGAVEERINDSKNFLDEISQHKEKAERYCLEIENINNTITSSFNEIQNTKEEINNTKEELNQKLNVIEVKKEEIDKFFIKIFGEKNEQGDYFGGLKERLIQKEKEIDKFLNNQKNQYQALFDKIESLLPAATSAGLATAYSKQKDSYKRPVIIWTAIFMFSLIGLCLTGLVSFEEFELSFKTLNLEQLFVRMPIILPLVWLATFSSKQYRQNKRLEQEYVHKEVLTRTYQGYKKEFESQDQEQTNSSKEMLSNLHKVLITTIVKNPSEIMDDGRSEDAPSIFKKIFDLPK